MAGTSATSSSSAASAPPTTEGAPETVQTGYMPGTPTGGAATSTVPEERGPTAFETEASPAAIITAEATLQSEFPEDVEQFQSNQEAKMVGKAEKREIKNASQFNAGLVFNEETGEYEWADLKEQHRPDDETAASKENFDSTNYTAYNPTDIEEPLDAFNQTEESETSDVTDQALEEEPDDRETEESDEETQA